MGTEISAEDILELIIHKLSPHEIFLYTLMLEGMSEDKILETLKISSEEYDAMVDKFNLLLESIAVDV
jgi:hypothetical protein